MGKVTGFCFCSQASAAALSGSTLTPSMVKPMALYFLWMSSSSGISCRHGPHHVAQKLIMTTWPLNWDRLMVLPPREASWKAGAGPVEDAANAADAKTAASAKPFAIPLIVRADIMRATPSEKDGRAEQCLYVVGDLGLAEEVGVEHPVLHSQRDRQPVGWQHAVTRAEIQRQPVVAGELHAANAAQQVKATVHGELATKKYLARQEVVAQREAVI